MQQLAGMPVIIIIIITIVHGGEARMIQHNDSDTSCMRALALLERTFASETELPLHVTYIKITVSMSPCHHVLHRPHIHIRYSMPA